jgi:prepilin-type N-terminal cleavage/methylation domain-containing protein
MGMAQWYRGMETTGDYLLVNQRGLEMDSKETHAGSCIAAIHRAFGFTLIELLVVISVIAVLLAILVPVMHRVRELGQRTVCLSNLRQLTLGWHLYAEDNDGRLINGVAFWDFIPGGGGDSSRILKSWIDPQLKWIALDPNLNSDDFFHYLYKLPNKGALWPYINDYDAYLCPRGQKRKAPAYSIVGSANGMSTASGTIRRGSGSRLDNRWLVVPGKRIGKTVLMLNNLQDIISPGPSRRAVFIDTGLTERSFDVDYSTPTWLFGAPPAQHAKGVTLSMADGHAEYWKWRGSETLDFATQEISNANRVTPQTDDGLYDLQRMQKVIWGRLGYSLDQK